MDPFKRHGIEHLSPSSLALYRHSPALWCLRYLYGVKDEANGYAWRGRAVEAAVDNLVIDGADEHEAVAQAKHAFEAQARGEIAPNMDKERRAIPGMVRQAAAVFRQLGEPEAHQQKVEVWLDDVEVPIVGSRNYVYPAVCIGLKTTHALPSQPRLDDAIQVAFYGDALSRHAGLIYVTSTYYSGFLHHEFPQEVFPSKGTIQSL